MVDQYSLDESTSLYWFGVAGGRAKQYRLVLVPAGRDDHFARRGHGSVATFPSGSRVWNEAESRA